jgi:hypothetical protein
MIYRIEKMPSPHVPSPVNGRGENPEAILNPLTIK